MGEWGYMLTGLERAYSLDTNYLDSIIRIAVITHYLYMIGRIRQASKLAVMRTGVEPCARPRDCPFLNLYLDKEGPMIMGRNNRKNGR